MGTTVEDRSLRAVRGWIGALFSTSLAAASHTLADGHLPPLPILGLVLVISAAICTALAGPANSGRRTALAVLLSQGTYHLIFSLVGHAPANGTLLDAGPHAGHSMQLTAAAPDVLTAAPVAMGPAAAWMPLAHALAALATIAVLRRGETAMLALLFVLLLRRPAAVLFARMPAITARPRTVTETRIPGPVDLIFTLGALLRRGPPQRPAF